MFTRFFKSFLLVIIFIIQIYPQGKVYLILGSDTAIWQGMNESNYHCYFDYSVIPDKTKNFYQCMQQSFRNQFSDSYGNKLKYTWWFLGGNMFRFGVNKNIPYSNSIVPYISKKFYSDKFSEYGDELTLHYHTYFWSDYNRDGIYYWNQAKDFLECKDDFDYTLAQYLLEENIFPVSFRSGWNTMDNNWQSYLDKILPFSMHNEAPAYRKDSTEPINNNYDWRLASTEFVPYKPSPANYQLPGNGKGWNLHSKYIGSMTSSLMNDIFNKANNGKDQVVCLWAHVWDDIYLTGSKKIDSLAHVYAAKYPNVKFKYCTAVEAMQLWMKTTDLTPPVIDIQEQNNGQYVSFIIQTNENIFQDMPFFAIKDINDNFHKIKCVQTAANIWKTSTAFIKKYIAKYGVAVTDTSGNLATKIIKYLPDDIYIDNSDAGYQEIKGNWTNSTTASWGQDSRRATIGPEDTAKVSWKTTLPQTSYYNIFIQIPSTSNPANKTSFYIYVNNIRTDTILFGNPIKQNDWIYLTTRNFEIGSEVKIVMEIIGKEQTKTSSEVTADVIKISPLVSERSIKSERDFIDIGIVQKEDTSYHSFKIKNAGTGILKISGIYSAKNMFSVRTTLPAEIQPMNELTINIAFYSDTKQIIVDSFIIISNDPIMPRIYISIRAEVENYFKLIDNGDSLNYLEFGQWNYSSAKGFNGNSRYALLNQNPRAYSVFSFVPKFAGIYDMYEILPTTVNATNNALYIIKQGNITLDSLRNDQNLNSGSWKFLKKYNLKNDEIVRVFIIDDGKATAGEVLRADAIKFVLNNETSNLSENELNSYNFSLSQNYPNPFNPRTVINYELKSFNLTRVVIYDLLGREIETLVNKEQGAGKYSVEWNASKYASGVYICQLKSGNFSETKKMALIK